MLGVAETVTMEYKNIQVNGFMRVEHVTPSIFPHFVKNILMRYRILFLFSLSLGKSSILCPTLIKKLTD